MLVLLLCLSNFEGTGLKPSRILQVQRELSENKLMDSGLSLGYNSSRGNVTRRPSRCDM